MTAPLEQPGSSDGVTLPDATEVAGRLLSQVRDTVVTVTTDAWSAMQGWYATDPWIVLGAAAVVVLLIAWIAEATADHWVPGRRIAIHRAYLTAVGALKLETPKVEMPPIRHQDHRDARIHRKMKRREQSALERAHRYQVVTPTGWVGPGKLSGAVISYPANVSTHSGAALRKEFEALWQERHPHGDWKFEWDKQHVTVTVRAGLPDRVDADRELLDATPWHLIPIGHDRDGTVLWDVHTYPHALIGGTTGAGKSVTFRTIATFLLRHRANIVAFDPKRVEFGWMAGRPGVRVVTGDTIDHMLAALQDVRAEMRSRYTIMESAGVQNWSELDRDDGPLFVLVDEARDLLDARGAEDKDARQACGSLLIDLARLGRAAHVFVILATQHPYADFFPGALRGNLGCRILCGHLSSHQASIVLDPNYPASAVPAPDAPKGRACVRLDTFREAQILWLSQTDAEQLAPPRRRPQPDPEPPPIPQEPEQPQQQLQEDGPGGDDQTSPRPGPAPLIARDR